MGAYFTREVDGVAYAGPLRRLNALEPERFPDLQDHHLSNGHWWVGFTGDGTIIAFAGLVGMHPFPNVGYLKRAYVLPRYRGGGLQAQFLRARERKARELGWTMLVTECASDNAHSMRNLERAGFVRCEPEQCWGAPGSIYFKKTL